MSDTLAAASAHVRPSALAVYWHLALAGYRRWATYRGATVAGIFTNSVFGFMRAYVLIALFTARPHVGGYTVADALTYTWVTQGILMAVYIWSWYEIALRIRSGDVITDLQRPVNFQMFWLAQDLGRGAYHLIFRGIPPFLLGALFFHLFIPHQPATYALFLLSMLLAVSLSFSMRFITNLLAFWVMDYRGLNTMAAVVWTFLSGSVVPLAILPGVWRNLSEALPFAGIMQTPIDIFLEQRTGTALLIGLGLQVFWLMLFLAAGQWLLRRAMRRVEIQGG